jgi:integrase
LVTIFAAGQSIKQWPNLGVQTKFRKRATTYFLDIPDLLQVVEEWDLEVRSVLPDNSFWFAPISPESGNLDPSILEVGKQRDSRARKDLKDWLDRAGLPYHSPHKFRHGHAVYALQQAKDIPDLKAVSQNLMHSNLSITDGVYGILSDNSIGERITALGKSKMQETISRKELLIHLEAIVAELKHTR